MHVTIKTKIKSSVSVSLFILFVLSFWVGLPGLVESFHTWPNWIEQIRAGGRPWQPFIFGGVLALVGAVLPWAAPPLVRRVRSLWGKEPGKDKDAGITGLLEERSALRHQLSDLQHQHDILEAKQEESRNRLREAERLTAFHEDTRRMNEEQSKQIEDLTRALEATARDRARLEAEVSSSHSQIHHLEQQVRTWGGAIPDVQQALRTVQGLCAKIERSIVEGEAGFLTTLQKTGMLTYEQNKHLSRLREDRNRFTTEIAEPLEEIRAKLDSLAEQRKG